MNLFVRERICSQSSNRGFLSDFLIIPEKKRNLNEDDQLIILPSNLLIYHGKPLITKPIRFDLYPKHDAEK